MKIITATFCVLLLTVPTLADDDKEGQIITVVTAKADSKPKDVKVGDKVHFDIPDPDTGKPKISKLKVKTSANLEFTDRIRTAFRLNSQDYPEGTTETVVVAARRKGKSQVTLTYTDQDGKDVKKEYTFEVN